MTVGRITCRTVNHRVHGPFPSLEKGGLEAPASSSKPALAEREGSIRKREASGKGTLPNPPFSREGTSLQRAANAEIRHEHESSRSSRRKSSAFAFFAALALAACSQQEPPTPTFQAQGYPEHLSDWGVIETRGGALELAAGVTPYDIATPLFSDHALKLRTVWMPEGTAAIYDPVETFDFPVGTIITKSFFYPKAHADWDGHITYGETRTVSDGAMPLGGLRLIETRIIAHREEGWIALPYVWNEDQTDAVLKRAGAVIPLTLHRPDGREEAFSYIIPNANQCAGCHATNNSTRTVKPIGPKARHLNKPSTFAAGMNQLDHWRSLGILTGDFTAASAPRNAVWGDERLSLDARARAYLDINCSHCHSNVGAADTSGLKLTPDIAMGPALGLCKSPVAAGSGSGGLAYDIVPGAPDQSILVFRMESTELGAMMPELGRSTVHEEGAALIRQWIAAMEGSCG